MILILMKRFFRKIRSVYRKNPPAYLSLAVIAISLTIGASVSNLGLIPQILRMNLGNCSIFNEADCAQNDLCSWIPRKRIKCGFNAKGKCPARCDYTPAQTQTLKCSDIKQRQACTPPCHWRSQTTRGECLEETSKPCSQKDCDDKKKGCWLKNTSSCSCTRWKNDFQGCTKNGCDWVKQTTCAGQTPTCTKWQITKQGSCSGGSSQQTSQAKCGGEFYYSNAKCVHRAEAPTTSPTPSPSPSSRTPCDPRVDIFSSDGSFYSDCPLFPSTPADPPSSFCQPDSDSPKGGYCQKQVESPFNVLSKCHPFSITYANTALGEEDIRRCQPGYDCVLSPSPGTDDFYICVAVSPSGTNQCNPNSTMEIVDSQVPGPDSVKVNRDCYSIYYDPYMICAQLPKPNDHLYTCQSSTSDKTLKPCQDESGADDDDVPGDWYAHGSTITKQSKTCYFADNNMSTGFEARSRLCSNGQWKDKGVTFVNSDDCPQVASCGMYDLDDSAQRKIFKEGNLHCCGKVVNYLDNKNNYGQTYRDYYNSICKPKEDKTSFWESLKEIF